VDRGEGGVGVDRGEGGVGVDRGEGGVGVDRGEGGRDVVLLDWQFWGQGTVAREIAYFMSLSVDVDYDKDMRLLRYYHTGLVERGVKGYSFEQFFRDWAIAQIEWNSKVTCSVSVATIVPLLTYSRARSSPVSSSLLTRLSAKACLTSYLTTKSKATSFVGLYFRMIGCALGSATCTCATETIISRSSTWVWNPALSRIPQHQMGSKVVRRLSQGPPFRPTTL
jgi:hypothetical protein